MKGTNITPQGYTYAIEPITTHPFWKNGESGDSNYIYADLKNPVVFENTDTNFTRFDAVLQGDVPFIAPLTLSLVSVTINSEVALPFVGVAHGDVAFLICEGISTNQLKVVGVYATTDMSDLQITDIKSIPAPIKGEKGDNGTNGKDGITPDVTATATVDQTTGNATVNVTKSGTDTQPIFNFAFTGLKGERGETGQTGATGEQGATGEKGADGTTPDITVIATVDETTGTPAVDVTKSGTTENPIFDFAFSGLKGKSGGGGESSNWKTVSGDTLTTADLNSAKLCLIVFSETTPTVSYNGLNSVGYAITSTPSREQVIVGSVNTPVVTTRNLSIFTKCENGSTRILSYINSYDGTGSSDGAHINVKDNENINVSCGYDILETSVNAGNNITLKLVLTDIYRYDDNGTTGSFLPSINSYMYVNIPISQSTFYLL